MFKIANHILIDYSKVLSGSFISRGVAFVNSIIIARLLGAEIFGMFSIFYICMTLTWQFSQSFDIGFVRFGKTSVNEEEKKEYLKSNVFLKGLYFTAGLLLSYPIGYGVSNWLMNKPELTMVISSGVVCGIFVTFLMTIATIYQEKEKFGYYSITYLLYTLSVFVILMLFYLFNVDLSLKSIVLIYLGVSAFVGLISIKLLLRKVKSIVPEKLETLAKVFGLGKWIVGVTLLYSLFQRLDVLLIARFSNFKEVGVYSAAAQITMLFSLFTSAMAGIFLPKTMKAVQSAKKFKRYLREVVGPICIVELMLLVIFIIAPFCLGLLYGDEFIAAEKVLRILIVGWFFHVLYLPLQYTFYAIDDSRTRFFLEAFKVCFAMILIMTLAPVMGAIGAAYSISIVMIINFGCSGFVLFRRLRHKFHCT